jgi:hypothetical protein
MTGKQVVRLNISFDGTMNIGAYDEPGVYNNVDDTKNSLSNVAKIYNQFDTVESVWAVVSEVKDGLGVALEDLNFRLYSDQ